MYSFMDDMNKEKLDFDNKDFELGFNLLVESEY